MSTNKHTAEFHISATIELDSTLTHTIAEMEQSTREAIVNALERAEEEGFNHPLGMTSSVTIRSVNSAPALLAENARLREALRECVTDSGSHCYTGSNVAEETDLLTRRLSAISDLARAALQGGGL